MAANKTAKQIKPMSGRRKALLAAATTIAGLTAYHAFKPYPTPTQPPKPVAPIFAKIAIQSDGGQPKITWEEALKRIEKDARERRDAGTPPEKPAGVNLFGLTESAFFYQFNKHEANVLSQEELPNHFLVHSALPLLHKQLYARLNREFEDALLHHVRGEEIPKHSQYDYYWHTMKVPSFSELVTEAKQKTSNEQEALKALNEKLLEIKVEYFGNGEANSGHFMYEKGNAILLDNYQTSIDLSTPGLLQGKVSKREVREYWRNR